MATSVGPAGRALLVLISVVSTVTAAVLLSREPAGASDGPVSQRPGVIAVPLRLSVDSDGIAIIDRTRYTICLYQYQPRRPAHERFVLVAARSFRYDCRLEDYNTASPRPAEVKQMLQEAAGKPIPRVDPDSLGRQPTR